MNKQNEVTGSSSAGRYVPPHERKRLQEQQQRESEQRPSAPQGPPQSLDRQPYVRNDKFSNSNSGNGNRAFNNPGRGPLTSSSSGGGRWNAPGGGGGGGGGGGKWKDVQYGPDGLFPSNTRLEDELFAEENSGINFDKYEDIPIDVQDSEKHVPIEKFTDTDLGPVLNNNLRLAHFENPTPIQKVSIPIALKGRDLMACAQTGSGKTAAFLFPMISMIIHDYFNLPPRNPSRKVSPECLILAPTRELAIQIHQQARKFTYRSHIKTVVVYGGADLRTQAYELDRGCNILVATPGRLLDMTDRGKLSLAQVKYLCIDEADRMLDMGFEPQIRKIVDELPGVEHRQTMMFSATFPREIQKLAEDFLKEYVFLRVGRVGSTTDYITQKVMYVEDMHKKDRLIDLLDSTDGLTLVFVETKRLADHLEEFLYNQNFSVISIHGDRSQKERESALEAFRSGQCRILVATDVAARGLDVRDVKHVVNYDLPHDINDYVHRIGRTGRCGTTGTATAFFNEKNKNLARDLVELMEESGQNVESFLHDYANPQPFQRNNRGKRGGGRGGGGGRWTREGGGGYGGGRGGGRPDYNSGFGGSRHGTQSFTVNGSHGASGNFERSHHSEPAHAFHASNENEGGADSWW